MIVSVGELRVSIRDRGTEGFLADRAAFSQVFLAGEYDFLLARMRPGDVVLDAGANIGCFSLRASRRVGAAGRVIAVEPEPSNADCLEANVRLNHLPNVTVIRKALDAVPGRTVDIVGTGTTAHVSELATRRRLSDMAAETVGTVAKTMTLDDVMTESSLDRLDVIKIDIEGAENQIFATPSSSSVLAGTRVVAVEVHDAEGCRIVEDRLKSDGYSFVSAPKSESEFLLSSLRHAARRPNVVLRLYGSEVVSVVRRMASRVSNAPAKRPGNLLAMVYASR